MSPTIAFWATISSPAITPGLAGHVHLDDHVILGAYAGVHQFCRIGAYSMVGGKAKLTQDLPPYLIVDGNPAVVRAYNKIGLERAGFSSEQMDLVKFAFRSLYREGLNRAQALERMRDHPQANTVELARVLDFARKSERGFPPRAARLGSVQHFLLGNLDRPGPEEGIVVPLIKMWACKPRCDGPNRRIRSRPTSCRILPPGRRADRRPLVRVNRRD